jgi:hypothetical protein
MGFPEMAATIQDQTELLLASEDALLALKLDEAVTG